jgi:hypothetical protein
VSPPPIDGLLSRVRGVLHRRAEAPAAEPVPAAPAPEAPAPAPPPALPAPDLPELEREARYHRERLALYRARATTGRPVDLGRQRELQRTSDAAEERLRHARG